MSGFAVEVRELRKLVARLQDCAGELESGLNALRDIGPKGLGFDFFDEACEHFQDKWENGLDEIRDSVDDLKSGLKQITDNYEKNEHNVAEAMNSTGGN